MSALPTTPFGRHMLTFAHVATQMAASARSPDKVVHKWKVFNAICTARPRLRVSERALSVLNGLLSFYPDTTLAGEDELIVFASNEQLCFRTHGMPASTLRRHLAVLVDAGLIVRRDSPNGKRYPRKGRGGEIKLAFRFDLSPLVVRAEEFERLAREIEAEARAVKLAKERFTLCRRTGSTSPSASLAARRIGRSQTYDRLRHQRERALQSLCAVDRVRRWRARDRSETRHPLPRSKRCSRRWASTLRYQRIIKEDDRTRRPH